MEPQTTTTKWQIIIKYSMMYALSSIALSMILFILGLQTKSSWVTNVITLAYVSLFLFYGIKARRDESLNGFITYGQGVGTGVLIALCAGVVISIFAVINITIIDPELMRNVMEEAKRKMIENGDSEEKIEMATKWMANMQSPAYVAIGSLVGNLFIGLIVSLVISIFTKKDNPDATYNSLSN